MREVRLTRNARESLPNKRWKRRTGPEDTADTDAAKRLRHPVKQSPSSSSAIPHQVEKPVSSILQEGKRDVIAEMSDTAAAAANKARTSLDAYIDQRS